MTACDAAPASRGGLLGRIFAMDLRSLAGLRIGLAVILLCDLACRCQWLKAHYSDEGILPRRALLERYDHHWFWSLHLLSGAWQVEAGLFAVAAVCASAMLVGYRTRLATILSWVLLASLQTRNPLLLQGGDVLLRCLMFWAMFLPLGARWSLDRSWGAAGSSAEPPPRAISSIATIAIMLQVLMVYWCTGAMKNHPIWTTDHTAIQYALSLGAFATPLGAQLLHLPGLLHVITASCLLLERFGPFLVLIPLFSGSFRLAAVLLFIGFHLGLALTMRLGPFPFICIAAWVAFLPSMLWDAMAAWLSLGGGVTVLLPAGQPGRTAGMAVLCGLLLMPRAGIRAELPPVSGSPFRVEAAGEVRQGREVLRLLLRRSPWAWPLAGVLSRPASWGLLRSATSWLVGLSWERLGRALRPPVPSSPAALPRAGAILCGAFLILTALWNLRGIAPEVGRILLPNSWDPLIQVVRLDQRWNMFAPFPTRSDIWYSAPATQRGGGQVDLMTDGPLAEHAPTIDQLPFYTDERWRKYLSNLREKENAPVRTYFAQYLFRTWNDEHSSHPSEQVTRVDIRLWSRTTHLDHEDAYRPKELWFYEPGHHAKPSHAAVGHAKAPALPPTSAVLPALLTAGPKPGAPGGVAALTEAASAGLPMMGVQPLSALTAAVLPTTVPAGRQSPTADQPSAANGTGIGSPASPPAGSATASPAAPVLPAGLAPASAPAPAGVVDRSAAPAAAPAEAPAVHHDAAHASL